MTGAYPDMPAPRIEYDRDGSGYMSYDGSIITIRSTAQAIILNDETLDSSSQENFPAGTNSFLGVVFAQTMDIKGIYYRGTAVTGSIQAQYSGDTTNGQDGSWSNITTATTTLPASAQYRTIFATTLNAVKGVRLVRTGGTGGTVAYGLHLYGYRTSMVGNFLEMWHPTLDQAFALTPAIHDLGDRGLMSGICSFNFRVKNCSTTLTAQGIGLTRECIIDASPSILLINDMNYNGGAYANSLAIGNLAPGAISSVINTRFNVGAPGPPGLFAPRIIAAATAWA